MPYQGNCEGRVHLVPIQKLADILSKGWQGALQAGGGMGGMGGMV